MIMEDIKSTVRNKTDELSTNFKKKHYMLTAFCLTTLAPTVAMAADAESKAKKILTEVMKLFPAIGLFFMVAGGLKLVLAYRNDQPEAQTGAAKDIVIGAALTAFSTLFKSVLLD